MEESDIAPDDSKSQSAAVHDSNLASKTDEVLPASVLYKNNHHQHGIYCHQTNPDLCTLLVLDTSSKANETMAWVFLIGVQKIWKVGPL